MMDNTTSSTPSDTDETASQRRRTFLKTIGVGAVSGLLAGPAAASPPNGNGSDQRTTFVAACSGDEEVPPVDTNATGTATFTLGADESELQYKLRVANIEDVVAAHIHYEVANENGAVVAGLFSGSLSGRTQGVIAEGTITADDLIGPFADEAFSTLLDAIRDGHTYVNVHTEANPSGEIRGQIGEQATSRRTVPEGQTDGQVTIIHDTHFHGRFDNIANYFGLMNRIDAESVGSMKVGNGDDLASSVLSSFFDGKHMTDAFNAGGLRYDTFGNHDFDMGPETNRDRVADSEFTWLSANLRDERTGDVWAKELGARTYVLDEVGDVTVGVTGVINEEAPEITSLGENAVVNDIAGSLREVVPRIRANGADVVVVLSHVSSPTMEEILADLDDVDIDAVVGDHAGIVFEDGPKEINGTHLSAVGDEFDFVGELTLTVEGGSVADNEFTLYDLSEEVEEGLEPDPNVQAVKQEYEQRLEEFDEPVGQTQVPLETREDVVRTEEANTGNYIADKMQDYADSDVALMNGGGIRTGTLYYPDATAESPADISKLTVFNVLPFGNTVVKLEVKGKDIRAALENGVSKVDDLAGRFPQVGGLSYTWNPDATSGERILEVSVGGEPLDDDATYTLATPNFVAGGGDGYSMFADAPRLIDENNGRYLANLIVDSIEAESPIAPTVEGRITEASGSSSSSAARLSAWQF